MKRIVSLAILLATMLMANANPVDVKTAAKVGFRFLNASTAMKVADSDAMLLARTYHTGRGDAAFYVFNTASGFVIVAADDCAKPILAYSDEGSFVEADLPSQMRFYLQDYSDQIQAAQEHGLQPDELTARQWCKVKSTGRLTEAGNDRSVGPLLTSRWNQNRYYNRFCPTAPGGPNNHAYAGCVATAMAQVMRFWGYPETGNGSHSYTPSSFPQQSVNFGETTYQWSDMLDELKNDPDISEIRPVATLIWHCGVSVDMEYGATGSGADLADVPFALVNYFKYDGGMEQEFKNDDETVFYSDEAWFVKVKACLDLGRPLLYGGVDESIGYAHAFVCDGYDASGNLHFNWGWSGEGNGYFSIGALNVKTYQFNRFNSAIFNICPENDVPHYDIVVTAVPPEGGVVSGAGSYQQGETCVLSAVANEGFSFVGWKEQGAVVATTSAYSFLVDGNRTLEAVFEQDEEETWDGVIDLYPGWNWISYLLTTETPLEEALINLAPSEGDMIKSQDKFSNYHSGAWSGTLTTLTPGRGLIYLNTSNQTKTFYYPTENR